jgi:AcrR family transcriptional regulator
MNEHETRDALVGAGRSLFARHGYDGTSVRAITGRARANLGAITYHFGSKAALYHAVIASFTQPLRDRLSAAAASPGPPLDRVDAVVRAYFDYFAENPELPRLMLQHLSSGRGPPPPVIDIGRHLFRTLAAILAEGQFDDEIRPGHPALLATSIIAQPIFFNLLQPVLREVAAIDFANPKTREDVAEHAVAFVRAGIAPSLERPS